MHEEGDSVDDDLHDALNLNDPQAKQEEDKPKAILQVNIISIIINISVYWNHDRSYLMGITPLRNNQLMTEITTHAIHSAHIMMI